LEEETYPRLLAPLGAEPAVWARCLFADPIADIAVLGQPDNQSLGDEADAYDELMNSMATLPIADAPAQGTELVTLSSGDQFENVTPGEGFARVLSLEGDWRKGRVLRRDNALSIEKELFVCGMSGSPIIDANGAAIGVISTDQMNPVIVDSLSARLVRTMR
jgi:hypothetical protein